MLVIVLGAVFYWSLQWVGIPEDVQRGAELSFSGPLRGPPSRPLRGPCIIVKFWFQTTKFWFQTDRQTDRRTDGRTDGQTDGQTQ